MSGTVSPLAPERISAPCGIPGVRLAAVEARLRYRDRKDLALAVFEPHAAAAGVFTRSATPGHPVCWCRDILRYGRARALLVNAGNANVFRGAEGDEAVRKEADAVAAALGCAREEVFVASTGVIGERLPVERITAKLPALVAGLAPHGALDFAHAIMTTDTFPKLAEARFEVGGVPASLLGIAKGSGMIAPNMATMLAFLFTDAALPPAVLQPLLARVVAQSFNAITVDGDTSTSDMVLLFATGRAATPPIERPDDARLAPFQRALEEVCRRLAQLIVRDGEGAQRFVEIRIRGALDETSARRIGLTVANSPLVKTAIAGADANWGRIVAAVGRAGEPIARERLAIAFGGHWVARDGCAAPQFDEAAVTAHLRGREILIEIVVGEGPGTATVWTCDLTHGYIDINASYRS